MQPLVEEGAQRREERKGNTQPEREKSREKMQDPTPHRERQKGRADRMTCAGGAGGGGEKAGGRESRREVRWRKPRGRKLQRLSGH